MTTIPLSIINARINEETALCINQVWINKNPDFQREYDAWDDKLKTRFVETMLSNRAMNPIWTIFNPDNNSEEILDGMHRITTATDFINGKFFLVEKHITLEEYKKYNKKYFKDLHPDDQAKIRNYNFIFNHLDSSYRTDINKRKDMYEILNRSSKTLNEYEFNKVLYNPFYEIISENKLQLNNFLKKKDQRGEIETEIMCLIVLSEDIPSSWSSMPTLVDNYLKNKIGDTEEKVNIFLVNNKQKIKNLLDFTKKIIERLTNENVFSNDKRMFNKYFLPYKCIISRLCFKLKNIANFNRYIKNILNDFNKEILNIDIQRKLNCRSRNAMFQKHLIQLIDEIIDRHYDNKDNTNNRLFSKIMISDRLKEQENKCNICKKDLTNIKYEADHIKKWSTGGKTEYNNLQILCIHCHREKD